MSLNGDTCYQALVSHDTRFDGVFFVGITSTGIYCRPVCPARTPRRENCRFYPSAAAAEQAGFRPCLRCRPELAPGNAIVDAVSRLAASAASRIEDGALSEHSVEHLADELGVSERHLRRALKRELGVSPIALAQTQRLLMAKRLLTDTDLPIIEVAYASGFASVRRFNTLFKERYRLSPSELRSRRRSTPTSSSLTCTLAYRPPLAWSALLDFLRARTFRGVEWIDGRRYLRTVRIGEHQGWIAIAPAPDRPTLRVEVSLSLVPVLLPVLARTKRLFDLRADPQTIAAQLGPIAAAHPGLRVPGAFDGFETAMRAILGQQVSVKAAATLASRLAAHFGTPISTPFAELTHLAPSAATLAAASPDELTACGVVRQRALALIALAQAVHSGAIGLEPGGDLEETRAKLKELPGIGEWTAQYISMRALGDPDAFPYADLGLLKASGVDKPKQLLEVAQQWQPWRAYAAMHLWKSLENPV